MLRLQVTMIYTLMCLASALFASGTAVRIGPVLLSTFSVFLVSIAAYMVNDIFDLEVDKISNPSRPLPAGIISVRQVVSAVVLSIVVSCLLVFSTGSVVASVLIAVCAFMVFAYSAPPLRLRRFPVAPYVTIATFAALSFLLGAAVTAGDLSPDFLLGAVLIFGFSAGSCMLKEFKDTRGDSEMNVRSLPVVLGPTRAAMVTVPVYLVACVLLLPFLWLYGLSPLYLGFFIVAFAGKVSASRKVLQAPSDPAAGRKALGMELLSTILLLVGASISAVI